MHTQEERSSFINPTNLKYSQEYAAKDLGTNPNRGCTNCCCLLLFLLLWGGVVYLARFAFQNGDPMKLTTLYDSDIKPCPVAYPFLYFPKPTPLPDDILKRVCVQECPLNMTVTKLNCAANSKVPTCQQSGEFLIYPTTPVLKRLCLPSDPGLLQNLDQALKIKQVTMNIGDVVNTWPLILALGGFSILLGFLYLCLVKNCASPVVWAMIGAFLLGLVGLGFYLRRTAQTMAATSPTATDNTDYKIYFYSQFVAWAAAAIFTIIFCCCYENINLGVAVIKSAALFVSDVISALFIPPIIFVMLVLCTIAFAAVGVYIYTMGTLIPPPDPRIPIGTIQLDQQTKMMLAFHFFALFWSIAFLFALFEFIMASCVCMWYFKESHLSYVLTSVYRAFRFHLGSLAFGSLLIALLWVLRVIFEYVAEKVRNLSQDDPVTRFILCCTRCCLDCFERFIQYLNRNTYIQIAITGKDFLESAADVISLLAKDAAKFGIVAGLSGIFSTLGKICITSCSIIAGYVVLTRDIQYSKMVTSPVIPCLCIGILAFMVSSLMMSVYSMASEAILQCYLVDFKRNDGHAVLCPDPLRDCYVDAENK